MSRFAVIGSKDHGQYLKQLLTSYGKHEFVGFYDDFRKADGEILGPISRIVGDFKLGKFDSLAMGIGYQHLQARKKIFAELTETVPFLSFIHPDSSIDSNCKIGEGCIVGRGCIFDQNVRIGPNCYFNPGTVIAHDTVISGHSFFAPSTNLAGQIYIGECCFLGINCTISNGLRLTSDVIVGAGTLVLANVNEPGTYTGVVKGKSS